MVKGFCLVISAERYGEYRLSNHLLHNHVTNRVIFMDIHIILGYNAIDNITQSGVWLVLCNIVSILRFWY